MRKTLSALGAILIVFSLIVSPVSAAIEITATTEISAQVLDGGLGLSTSESKIDFGAFEKGEIQKTHPGDLTILANQVTANNLKVLVSGTQLRSSDHTISRGSLVLDTNDALIESNSDDVTHLNSVTGTFIVDNNLSHTIVTAEEGEVIGGEFSVVYEDDALTLTTDEFSTKPGIYESVITWKLVSGE